MRTGLYFILTVIIVMELLALTAIARTADLERIHADHDGTWYINGSTMVNPSGDRASFWSTVVPMKDSAYYDRLGMVLEKRGKNPGRLAYVQLLQEVDCSLRTIHISNVLFYDKRDRIVHTVNSSGAANLIDTFGQASDSILASVCGTQQLAQLMGE